MPYKPPTFREAPRPLTVQRALFLACEQAIARQSAESDLEQIGAALVEDLQHEMQKDRAEQLV